MDDHRSQAEILAAISEAREDLTASLADLQATVDQLNARPLLTHEERQALEEKIRGGEDTWDQVFSGQSPNGALLQGHLDRMVEEHQDDIALAFEELVEEEEAKGNFLLDDVPTAD